MAILEGVGIAAPSKESSKKATAFLGNFKKKADEKFIKTYEQKQEGGIQNSDFETEKYKKLKEKYGDEFSSDTTSRFSNQFSPSVEVASLTARPYVSSDVSDDIEGYNNYLRENYATDMEGERYKSFPPVLKRTLRESYNEDRGLKKEGDPQILLNKKPSFVERTKELAGNIFNAVTGTQSAAASEMPTDRPGATQFSSKNLDAARDTSFSSYVRGGGEGQERGSVSTSEPKQTVASLPSDYKQTEAREFAKSKAYKSAKKNPNVKVTGVDDKGRAKVKAVQKTRKEAGPKARTAEGNKARVKQNARARAQAAAYNRKISGEKPKSAKERAQASAKARRAAGPNRKMSDGQKTRAQAGPSARTAQGNRARVKSNARKRAQAAAKRRRACDIFLKHDISPLTNMNLIKDDLAEVAYFVKEIQK